MVITRSGVKVTKAQLKGALSRYRRGETTLRQIEEGFGVYGQRGKFIKRAWAKDLDIQTNSLRTLVTA